MTALEPPNTQARLESTVWDGNTVTLSDLGLNDDHAAIIAAKLVGAKLSILYLDDNEISDEGAIAIADAITGHTELCEFHIAGNQIGHDGATALAAALKTCPSLDLVDVGNNRLGHQGIASFRALQQQRPTIRVLGCTSYAMSFPLNESDAPGNIRKLQR